MLLYPVHRRHHQRGKKHGFEVQVEVGQACPENQDTVLGKLHCRRLELAEIWCFCYAKDKNLPDHMQGIPGVGSMWTWTAIDAELKLMASWRLGNRDSSAGQPTTNRPNLGYD
jgi:hypothetical protein